MQNSNKVWMYVPVFLLISWSAALAERPLNEIPMYAGNSRSFTENATEQQIREYKSLSDHYAKAGWRGFYENDLDTAIKRFNQAWLYNQGNPAVYWGFAVITGERGKQEGNIDGLEEAITYFEVAKSQLSTNAGFLIDMAVTVVTLNCAQQAMGNMDRARVDIGTQLLLQAKKITPHIPVLWLRWAEIECAGAHPSRAADNFRRALDLDPDYVEALNSYAWFLATYPDGKFRDGKLAVKLAKRALKHSGKIPSILDTLAAGYAEISSFGQAIATQKEAISLEEKANEESGLLGIMQAHLQSYQQNQRWRSQPVDFMLSASFLIKKMKKATNAATRIVSPAETGIRRGIQ